MENIKRSVEDIIDDLKEYVDTAIELQKLKATEKAAEVISTTIISLTLAFVAGFALLFISFAAAFMLSHYFQITYLGFILVAAFYMLIAFFILITKDKWLKHRLVNNFIQAMYSK